MGFFDSVKKEYHKTQNEIRENEKKYAQFVNSEIINILHIDDEHNWFYFRNLAIGPGHFKPRVFESDQLEAYQVSKDGSTVISGGVSVGRAIVGNIIAGPAGLILGGITGKRKHEKNINSIQIIISLTNGAQYIAELVNKPIAEGSREHENLNNSLNGIIDYFESILESRRIETDKEPVNELQDNHEIVIETLRKYKQLLDEEIITEEEFDAKKKELLN